MIISIGEILCDLIGTNNSGLINLEVKLGGAPFNVASNLSNLGIKTKFIGAIGDDIFGNFIINEISKFNSLETNIERLENKNTTLAICIKKENNENEFEFIRKNGADYSFKEDFLNNINLNEVSLCHFGSLFLSSNQARKIIYRFIKKLRKTNILVSFDVNFRKDIFTSNSNLLHIYKTMIDKCDIVKFTEEEIKMLSNKEDLLEAIKYFNKPKIIFVTMGANGSLCFYKGKLIKEEALKNVTIIDSIGAGDSFFSGVLYALYEKKIELLTEEEISYALKLGNKCAAKTLGYKGAVNAYKSIDEVME